MNQNKGTGRVIFGVASFILAGVNGIIGLIFSIIGGAFLADPENVDVTVNGRVLTGQEAVEAAEKLGRIFSTVGVVTLILCVVFVVLGIVLVVSGNKMMKQARLQAYGAMGYNQYNQYQTNGYANQYQNNNVNMNQYQTPNGNMNQYQNPNGNMNQYQNADMNQSQNSGINLNK